MVIMKLLSIRNYISFNDQISGGVVTRCLAIRLDVFCRLRPIIQFWLRKSENLGSLLAKAEFRGNVLMLSFTILFAVF